MGKNKTNNNIKKKQLNNPTKKKGISKIKDKQSG